MQDIVLSQPSREALQQQIDKARQDAIERRVKELQAQGIVDAAARARAQREIDAAALAPRLTEFGAPARPAGYSEFAVRGAQAAGELTPGEAVVEGFKPQVLETSEQAASRRRYEQAVKKSKQIIEEEAKRLGITPEEALPRILVRNQTAAVQYVKDQFGEDDPEFMTKVQEVQAAMNAPYFAGAGELRPKMLGEAVAGRSKDILRGLTTSEVQGRLVETRGVAAMRGLGGLSRVLVRGAEEAVVDPIMRNVVAAVNPGVTAEQLKQEQEEQRAAAGGSRVVSGPGVQYSEGAATRRKADTGSFVRDVAFEVATGRSAVDDYIDAGMSESFAVPLGIATEFAIPITPIGAVTDVAPAFKSVATGVARAARVPAGAARAGGRAALGAAIGGGIAGPVGAVGGAAIGALSATKRMGRIADAISDIPQVVKLRQVAKSIQTIPQFGEAIASSKFFREAIADAGSARLNLAETVAREGADIGQLRATLNALKSTRLDDVVDLVENSTSEFARSTGKLIERGRLDVQSGIKTEEQLVKEVKQFVNDAFDSTMKSDSAITRTAIREGDRLGAYTAGSERNIDVVRERVLAETIDAVPTDNYFFITDRMLVNRSVLNTDEFKEAIRTATSNLPEDASISTVNRAIEDAIRQTFRGRNTADIAEVTSVNVPRTAQQEGIGLFEMPRGGIERLQTAPSRRRVAYETLQDVFDARVMVTRWWNQNGQARFANALKSERVPVEVAEFMRTTSDKLDNVPGRMYAAFGVMARKGVPEVLDAYVSARLIEDSAGGTSGVFNKKFINDINDTVEVPRADMDEAVKDALGLFFGPDNLRAVFGQDTAGIIDDVIRNAPDDISITRRLETAIADIRVKAGGELDQTGMIRAFGSWSGDPRSAIVQFIMSREAKAAFREGIATHLRPVYGTTDDYVRLGTEFEKDLPPVSINGVDVTEEVRGAVVRFLNDTLEDGTPRINKIVDDFKWISQKTAGKYVYESNYAPELLPTDVAKFSTLRQYIKEALSGLRVEERTAARAASTAETATLESRVGRIRDSGRATVSQAKSTARIDIAEINKTAREDIAAIKAETQDAVKNLDPRGRLAQEPGQAPRYVSQREDIARIEAEGAERVRLRQEQQTIEVQQRQSVLEREIDEINAEVESQVGEFEDAVRAGREEGAIEEAEMRAAGVDLGSNIDDAAFRITNDYILHGMTPRLVELASRLEDARAAAGWGNHVTIQSLSELVDLPIPAPLAKTLREYFGNIDDLTKMKGIIGDNIAEVVSISPGMKGVAQLFAKGIVELLETSRALTAGGLTAGMFLPNFRYHAVNFETAPLVQAFTSPAYLADTLGARIFGLSPTKTKPSFFGVPSAAAVRAFRGQKEKVLITTTNGVQYTAGQLNKILDETFFGMSANTFVMSDRMLDDIIINTSVPSGIPGFRATAIEGLRYMGMRGTNPMIRFANKVDRAWRETAFLAALKNGLTPQQSIEIAKNAFLDYGKIPLKLKSEFGKYMMFASWMIMNNAELLRAFLTSKGGANIIKINKAQREMHRAYGDWTYSDDATKKRLWSYFIGDFDGVPAFAVGPENPAVGPMLDNIGPTFMTAYLSVTGDTGLSSDAVPAIGTWLLKNSFTPAFQYAKDVGLVGSAPMSDIVPAKSIAAHQLMGPDHFQQFMDENGITVVPYDKRRPGEPTFNGEQYQFVSDAAKEKWARTEFFMTFLGTQRAYEDAQSYMLYAGITPPGMDVKRFRDMNWLDFMAYMGALETRQKGKTEYEAYMRAMTTVKRELTSGQGVPRIPESDLVQFEPQQAPQ